MSRQFWRENIAWSTASGSAYGASVTEAIIMPNLTIPANYLQDGRVLYGRMWGQISNIVTAQPTITFRIRWGGVAGTLLAATAAITCSATAFTAALYDMDFTIQTRSNGASGTLFVVGSLNLPNDATLQTRQLGSAGAVSPAAVTVDLTADTALSVTAQWGTNNASNTLTNHIYTLDSLN